MQQSEDLAVAGATEIELRLASGSLRARRFGTVGAPLTLCVHGLSANARSFDLVAIALASDARCVVAIDLRGRGWSTISGAGTYGWPSHARDVLDAATELGADTFDYVGHSMGAFIGMEVARAAAARVRRLVLIDAAGVPEAAALTPIRAAVQRLGASHADADSYVRAVRNLGTVTPWDPMWEAHYRYDLVEAPSGVAPRTDRTAVLEDLAHGATQDPRAFWPHLLMPTLLVRASRPLGEGFIVSEADRSAFLERAPHAEAVDVDANHYGVMTHPRTLESIRSFLS